MNLNINDNVLIKLTDAGRAELARQGEELRKEFPRIPPFKPRKEDEEGWSKWQFHDLMHTFGHMVTIGTVELPFKNEMRLDT